MKIKLYTKHEHFKNYLKDYSLVENQEDADLVISYAWARKISLNGKKGINLHISYLPFNRGADPNIWSWIDNTSKGVTIHWMDEGIDTGSILVQEMVTDDFLEQLDLRSSYEYLHFHIEDLFRRHFPKMLEYEPQKQEEEKATRHFADQAKEIKKWLAERGFRVLPHQMIEFWRQGAAP